MYKSGTGTRGRGHRDACVGTCDLGTRDEGLEDKNKNKNKKRINILLSTPHRA